MCQFIDLLIARKRLLASLANPVLHPRGISFHQFAFSEMNPLHSLFLVSCGLSILLMSGTYAQEQQQLQDMLGGFLQGMQEALSQFQPAANKAKDTDGKAADAEAGDGGGQPNQFEGIKNLVDNIDVDQLGKFFKNIASPDSLFDWIPAKFRALLPEEWRTKMGQVMVSELEKLAEVWEKVAKYKSATDLWNVLQEKTPTLAELLQDVWKTAAERWAQFEGGLEPEAQAYAHNIKASFGQWLSQQVLGPFATLSGGAKWNMQQSLAEAFPLLEPLLSKAVQSEALGQWAEQLGNGEQKGEEAEAKDKEEL